MAPQAQPRSYPAHTPDKRPVQCVLPSEATWTRKNGTPALQRPLRGPVSNFIEAASNACVVIDVSAHLTLQALPRL